MRGEREREEKRNNHSLQNNTLTRTDSSTQRGREAERERDTQGEDGEWARETILVQQRPPSQPQVRRLKKER